MAYRYLAASPEGVVQLIAASYLRHGYYWYVTGRIKEGKDPLEVDRKLIAKYGIDISEWKRAQRKKRGLANVHYLRYGRWFILLATEGHHQLKQPASQGGEGHHVKDCRRQPIRFEGYSISYRRAGHTPKGGGSPKWHAHVRIDGPTYNQLKAFFLDRACHRSVENLAADFARIPFARYAPICRQLFNILRAVNAVRRKMGYAPTLHNALRLRRQPVAIYAESAKPLPQAEPTVGATSSRY